jgi:hypothetical protein
MNFGPRTKQVGKALAAFVLLVLAVVLADRLLFKDTKVAPSPAPLRASLQPASVIGEGEDAVAVSPSGAILSWMPAPEDAELPRLPLSEPPDSGRLSGPMLQQARVLGAAPPALRPYIASSYYGESGVDVNLRSGIELYFGDPSQVSEKWSAAAAVLANPQISALDYVDLHAPRHPAIGGSSHTLPLAP